MRRLYTSVRARLVLLACNARLLAIANSTAVLTVSAREILVVINPVIALIAGVVRIAKSLPVSRVRTGTQERSNAGTVLPGLIPLLRACTLVLLVNPIPINQITAMAIVFLVRRPALSTLSVRRARQARDLAALRAPTRREGQTASSAALVRTLTPMDQSIVFPAQLASTILHPTVPFARIVLLVLNKV